MSRHSRQNGTRSFAVPLFPKFWQGMLALMLALSLPASVLRGDEGSAPRETVRALDWSYLPPLPVAVAGPFVGTSEGALLVAGGANFPDAPPWDGGIKVWYDRVFVLRSTKAGTSAKARWEQAGKLPGPRGYGVSLPYGDEIFCFGGSDSHQHHADSFALRWNGSGLDTHPLPALPKTWAMGAGVVADGVIYLAGGQETPTSDQGMHAFWKLDLRLPHAKWRWETLEAWPGEGRILPTMAVCNGEIYLIGGAALFRDSPKEDSAPQPVRRRFLRSAFAYHPGKKAWRPIADTPAPIVAAPTPAIPAGYASFAVLAGDDGVLFDKAAELKGDHPGFPRSTYLYHAIVDRWVAANSLPDAVPAAPGFGSSNDPPLLEVKPPVTTNVAAWNGGYVIASGEIRPGVRTPNVLFARPALATPQFGWINWTVLGAYLAVMLMIGFVCTCRDNSTAEYFLAGGRIPWWAAGLSIFGTSLSAITYLALPARVFSTDWSLFVLNLGIVAVAPLVVWFYLPLYRRLGITSIYEYLELRFSRGLRVLGSLMFVAAQIGRMGIVVFLPALVLSAMTGTNVIACIVLMGIISTLYTVLGGIEAVIWTDVIQVIVLLLGAGVALGCILTSLDGGLGEMLETGMAANKFRLADFSLDLTGDTFLVIVLGALFSNALVPQTTDQSIVQRYLTTSTDAQAVRAIWTNALMVIPTTILFFSVGTALFVFYQNHPAALAPLSQSDQIFAWYVVHQMPAGVAGLVIAGVFAAAMSSLDSSMHSAATVMVSDLVRPCRPDRPDAYYMRWARGITIAVGVFGSISAIVMSQIDAKFLWDMFLTILGLLGGTLAGLFMLGIFTRIATLHAWIGVVCSFTVLLVVHFQTHWNGLLYGPIGVVTCVVAGLFASQVIPGVSKDISRLSFAATAETNHLSSARSP